MGLLVGGTVEIAELGVVAASLSNDRNTTDTQQISRRPSTDDITGQFETQLFASGDLFARHCPSEIQNLR